MTKELIAKYFPHLSPEARVKMEQLAAAILAKHVTPYSSAHIGFFSKAQPRGGVW